MVSVCLPSNALLQHLPSCLGFSYLGRGVSLHGCSSKMQLLLLTLYKGYLLTTAPPDLHGIAPLGPPVPAQPLLLGYGVAPFRVIQIGWGFSHVHALPLKVCQCYVFGRWEVCQRQRVLVTWGDLIWIVACFHLRSLGITRCPPGKPGLSLCKFYPDSS